MLIDNETMWMSDGPEERLTMSSAVRWCPNNADVLIGGLGLGIHFKSVEYRLFLISCPRPSRPAQPGCWKLTSIQPRTCRAR